MAHEQVRRPRHLMDPANPVRPVNDASLTTVQRWVMSVLTVFTIAHLAVGLVVAALAMSSEFRAQQIGLCVLAGLFGAFGVAAGQLIHRRRPLNLWLLLGFLPTVIGVWLVLR
ncbi:hypothetical protein [Nocardioides insulae]|uniref:hypothetical protein n=1 Tax=Nocardioides insulae TaxID=394734 RepID=UPI00040E1E1D|nr:hypothetical protein [Nocardioides insulae]